MRLGLPTALSFSAAAGLLFCACRKPDRREPESPQPPAIHSDEQAPVQDAAPRDGARAPFPELQVFELAAQDAPATSVDAEELQSVLKELRNLHLVAGLPAEDPEAVRLRQKLALCCLPWIMGMVRRSWENPALRLDPDVAEVLGQALEMMPDPPHWVAAPATLEVEQQSIDRLVEYFRVVVRTPEGFAAMRGLEKDTLHSGPYFGVPIALDAPAFEESKARLSDQLSIAQFRAGSSDGPWALRGVAGGATVWSWRLETAEGAQLSSEEPGYDASLEVTDLGEYGWEIDAFTSNGDTIYFYVQRDGQPWFFLLRGD